MNRLQKFAAWGAGALAIVAALAALVPPGKVRGFDLDAFDRLPVLDGGRVKPIDSLARNTLLMIRGQQSLRFQGRTVQADEWMLDVMFRPEVSEQQPIFVINDPDVLGLMGIQQSADRYFAFKNIGPYIAEIERQAQAAHAIDGKLRTRFQGAIVNLYDRLLLFHKLRNTVQLSGSESLAAEIASRHGPGASERHQTLVELGMFRPLSDGKGDWRTVGQALQDAARTDKLAPALEPLARVGAAWAAQDASGFNAAVQELTAIDAAQPDAVSQANHETLFNRAQPFYLGMVVYVLALLVLFVSWIWRPQLLQPAAFGLLCAGAVIHTLGLAARIALQGRPPVTNLYSSAVFVGWVAVLVGVLLERLYKRGFGTAVAAASGFASLIIAHHLASDGDTMEMMRAVLDSNFWLATHVVAITVGYSGTFLAGAIALGWTFRKHFGKGLDKDTSKTLTSMVYGVVCFALFFSFVGTVLGGIWADQSWGRFWGWDPKENGALLIVLWNAIILHARWGGFARERGQMAMAIFGNVITSLSWFGVNMLGVGLHSYGFMDSAFYSLATFIATQLACMGLALAPPKFWRGKAAAPQTAAAQPARSTGVTPRTT